MGNPDPLGRAARGIPLALAAAAACIYLLAASGRDFWAPDEPDFAQAVREMNERGSWLLPYQNGVPYSEKPALFYWAMAATTPFTGWDVRPLALRVPSALSGAFLVFGASALALWRGGRREALLAGAATAVAPIVFWQGQFLQIDAMFSALLLAAFLCQILVEEDPQRAGRWRLGFQLILPLAILAKGPLALVLTGLFALVRCAARRSLRPILDLGPLRGALLSVVVVVPWYFFAARAGGPEYAHDLIVRQNWTRFFEGFDHVWPWWFYFESIWGDFSPWTLPALLAPLVLWREGIFSRRPELASAAQAAAAVFVFLSSSQSKQGKYLLVAYPVASCLLAAAVVAVERRRDAGWKLLAFLRGYTVFAAVLVAAAAIALFPIARAKAAQFSPVVPYVAVPLVVGGLGTAAVVVRRRKEAVPGLLALAATVAAGEAAAGAALFPAIDPVKTGRAFYERIAPRVSHGEPLGYFGQTYRCYPILVLRRRTAHLKDEEQLASWVRSTPGALVLADRSESRHWTDPLLHSLVVVDQGPVGGDVAQLLARP